MRKIFLLLTGFVFPFIAVLGQEDDSADFFSVGQIQELRVTFEPEDWRYLLDSLRFNGDDLLLADLQVNGVDLQDVGIRYIGSRSFQPGTKRNGLYLKLNFIKQNQGYLGHQSIHLSSALRDPSMVREVLGYEIAREYLPAPRANYAKVYINDEYYGLFVNVEVIEDAFLEENFGSSEGTFLHCEPGMEGETPEGCKKGVFGSLQYDESARCYLSNFELLSETGWDDLMELTRVLENEPERIEEVLNVDRTLWMLAFNNLIVNLSSYSGQYSNNYYLYKDEKGQFNPIIYDLNLAFGSFKNTGSGSDLNLQELEQLDPVLHAENPYKPLISVLLANEGYEKLYISHLRTIFYDHLKSDRLANRAKELQQLIREAFTEDDNRYYSTADFSASLENVIGKRSKIPGLTAFMENRYDFLKTHPALIVVPPEISEPSLEKRERLSSKMVESFKISVAVDKYTKRVHLFYRHQEGEDFRRAIMYDDGNHGDGEADDHIFGVEIQPAADSRSLEYYIFAENAKAVSFSPSRYMYERHNTSLDELNR